MTLTEITALKRHQSISGLLESLGYSWDGSHFTRGGQKIAWERIKGRSVGTFVDETLQHDPTLLSLAPTQTIDAVQGWNGTGFPFAWSPPLIWGVGGFPIFSWRTSYPAEVRGDK